VFGTIDSDENDSWSTFWAIFNLSTKTGVTSKPIVIEDCG